MRLPLIQFIVITLCGFSTFAQQHPIAYNTVADYSFIKEALSKTPLLNESFGGLKQSVDAFIGKDIDVPVPKDLAGGYTHERHKENYTIMFNSSVLYQITGEAKYAEIVKKLFLKYAKLNPTLKNHPLGSNPNPGRLFFQPLNDANWLVYTGLAFDGIYNYLTPEERKQIADGAFKPEVDYFTNDLEPWFGWIHNHAVWSCAGVGIVGIATDNKDYVDMALYGKHKDGKSGLLANLDGLLSPDGYYTEGPYYTRYAILPFYLFANALQHYKPELKVFNRRNDVLKNAFTNALQQTDIIGQFYSYNDALKEKNFTCNEMVEVLDMVWGTFGADSSLLPVARMQKRVALSRGGASIAKALNRTGEKGKNVSYPYKSIELTDGAKGDEGGLSILRTGKGDNLVSLIYKYSAHGLSHGHFDKLNINLYDGENEILSDYGAVRYISIEQKSGGKYLPESKTYSKQTIAHNTLVVDEKSDFDGDEEESQKYHPAKLFSNVSSRNVQVVCAEDDKAYEGVKMQRSIYMVNIPGHEKPLVVDLFNALSNTSHQYDLPFQYQGTFIKTNFKYTSSNNAQATLGKKNGYQHIWKEAEAVLTNKPLTQFTFLNDKSFYTISSITDDSTHILFTRTGANDPNFNLRREPAYIIRKKGVNQTFVNAVEIHGVYNANAENAKGSYSAVNKMEILQNDANYSVVSIVFDGKPLLIIQRNSNFNQNAENEVIVNNKKYSFTGNYTVLYNDSTIK